MSNLTHFDETGRPAMVDVSGKDITSRTAVAKGRVRMSMNTLISVKEQRNKKGNVEQVAELAGIMGAKNT
jgi:cyclic pyranopterin phosphate synthase